MITKIAVSLSLLTLVACTSTTSRTTSSQHATIRAQSSALAANSANTLSEPPPPAEGPEDVPAEGPGEVARNPGLVPTPLLRGSAAASP